MDGISGGDDSCRLLIEAVSHITEILSCRHHDLQSSDTKALLAADVLVLSLELYPLLFLSLQVLGRHNIEIERDRLVPIDSAKIPLVSVTDTDLCRRDKLI